MQIKDLIPWARKDDVSRDDDKANPITALQKDVNKLFEGFRGKVEQLGSVELPWGGGAAQSDVVETDDAVEVSIELPGMDMNDIEIMVTDDFLTIKGEKKVESQTSKKGYYLSERAYGGIYRSIPLPPGVDTDQARRAVQQWSADGDAAANCRSAGEGQADRRQERVSSADRCMHGHARSAFPAPARISLRSKSLCPSKASATEATLLQEGARGQVLESAGGLGKSRSLTGIHVSKNAFGLVRIVHSVDDSRGRLSSFALHRVSIARGRRRCARQRVSKPS